MTITLAEDTDVADMQKLVGTNLRTIRKCKGLTLKDVAQLTGLSLSMISQAERVESSPSISTLCKVAKALHVPVTAFFEEWSE